MAETQQQQLPGDGGDLFDGLGIDYGFLVDPSSSGAGGESFGADAENTSPAPTNGAFQTLAADQTLFENELMGDKSGAPDGGGDMLAPLGFAFHNTAAGGGGGGDGVRYHAAPQHKHKRVRSNPDVIQSFAASAMAMGIMDANGQPTRPSIVMSGGVMSGLTTPKPIGPVEVTSPVGLGRHAAGADDNQGGASASGGFQEMDEFLQELSWSELPSDAPSGLAAADATQSPLVDSAVMPATSMAMGKGENMVAYRAQRIQEGVNELKMKRKRPTASHHARHNSNPVDLLHNLDQFRMLAQQTKQQQQQQEEQQTPPVLSGVSSSGMHAAAPYANPFGGFLDPSTLAQQQQQQQQQQHMQMQMQMHQQAMMGIASNGTMNGGGVVNGGQFGFQVPQQIASGAVRSLHNRRSSVGSNMPPRSRRPVRSTGLSMDMSQMNLSFLAVPEEEFQQQLQQMNQEQAPPSSGGSRKKIAAATAAGASMDEAGRKMYKCGRCGQPKVGHVCTMPDQRNNWSQVDLEVTKGLKVMRINCHILPVKARWVPQHEDNVEETFLA